MQANLIFQNIGYSVKTWLMALLDDVYLEINRRFDLIGFAGWGNFLPLIGKPEGFCVPLHCAVCLIVISCYFCCVFTFWIWKNVVWIVWLEGAVCACRRIPPF